MKIKIRIEGVTPLICNRFSDEAAEAATNGRRNSSSVSDRGSPRDQAEKKLYVGLDGQTLMIPQVNIVRSIVEGGRFHKAGKKQVTTQRESMLFACFDIDGVEIPIEHKDPWRVDVRPVVIPSTKGRILAYRPIFDDWALDFVADLDTDMIGEKFLRDIVDDAGKRIGLGDFRPDRKGPFGKFKVTFWKTESKIAV